MVTNRDVLHVQLFGAFTLTHDGEPLPPLPSRHARLLFAWLALQRGRPQPRTLLCDLLWPDVAESRARRRLSHALWQIQDAFGEGLRRPYLLTPGDNVQFDTDAPYVLDVEEFEERLDEVDRGSVADTDAVRHLRRCVELYQGDLLAGSYEDWVVREQDRLRQRYVSALVRLVDACKQRGNFDEALAVARRLTHQAPLREEAHREVMKLCVLTGQPGLALEQYQRCRSVLAEELGVEPSAETEELHDRILHHRQDDSRRRAPADDLASDRLVARDEERLVLVDALERTLLGRPGTVFVEGEPGVGKSQLLAHSAEDARWRGFTVLWGTCEQTTAAYAPVREAIEAALDPVRIAQLRAALAPVWLAEASRLLPALADGPVTGGVTGAMDAGDAAERMRQALVEVVLGLATADPVVLVLEDLHDADAETMALLRSLARHPDPGRLLLLVSYRDVDARQDDAVWARLRDLDRDARPTRLHLDGLTPFATGALLREVLGETQLPAAFVEAVQREGGGNPLYSLELLRSLRDSGALRIGADHLDAASVPVTSDLRAVVRERLALLGPEAAAVAAFAAVLDTHADLRSLEVGVDLSPRALSAAVGELNRRNVLEPHEGTWRFTHAATRRVLLDDLDDDRRQQLHEAAADALEAAYPDDAEAIAAHLVEADLHRRALPHLRRATDRALDLHAYETAVHHLDAALHAIDHVPTKVGDRVTLLLQAEEVNDVLGDRDRQATLLDQLAPLASADEGLATELQVRRARLLGQIDELDEALETARAAVDRAPTAPLRGRALATVGELLHWQGRQTEAVVELHGALDLLDPAAATRARTRTTLASVLRALQRFDEARTILTEALRAAEEQSDELGIILAETGLADLDVETGSDGAVTRYDRTIKQARRLGYRHREGVALINLATAHLARAEPGPALAAYDAAADVFHALGNRRGSALVQLNRAWLCHRWLGRDEDAERDAHAALTYGEEVGGAGVTCAARETLAGIARRAGDYTGAKDHLDAGLATAGAADDRRVVVQLRRGEAELALARGDHAAALAAADAGASAAEKLGMREFVGELGALAATAAAESGRTEDATSWGRRAAAAAATSGEPHRVHHRLALVARATGAPATAAEHHRSAAALLDEALELLTPADRAAAEAVPAHRAIREEAAAHLPRSLTLRLARASAPLGRALKPDETVEVEVEVPPTRSPAERRAQLLAVLGRVEDRDAAATVEDLGTVFDVSSSTIRRDLAALRRAGHAAMTRGQDAG